MPDGCADRWYSNDTNRAIARFFIVVPKYNPGQSSDPPFDKSPLEPGFIKGYVPGVRENGGQYTHTAIWATMAFAKMGDYKRAWELFAMLNPINHASTPAQIARYRVESYVLCSDIYAAPPHTGRGGWTWYTEQPAGCTGGAWKPCWACKWKWIICTWHPACRPYGRATKSTTAATRRCITSASSASLKRRRAIRVTLDGTETGGAGIDDAGQPQGMIPLVGDHWAHYVEVELS